MNNDVRKDLPIACRTGLSVSSAFHCQVQKIASSEDPQGATEKVLI